MTLYSQFGRMGVGPAQGQFGVDYPLINPSDDIRHLVADFRLVIWPAENASRGPLWILPAVPIKISRLTGFGGLAILPATPKGIQLTDASGAIVFDSTDPLATSQSSYCYTLNDRLAVASWFQAVPDDLNNVYNIGYSARVWLIYHTAWNFEGNPVPTAYADPLNPASAVLLTRNIFVDDHVQGFTFPAIEEAANTEIKIEPAATSTTLSLSAGAGLGSGVAPCSLYPPRTTKETDAIHHINKVAADKYGNFIVSTADDCWWASKQYTDIRQYATRLLDFPVHDPAQFALGHLLTLGQACRACPDCEDYNDLIDRTNVVIRKFNRLSAQFPELRDRLKLLIDTWNANVLTKKRNRLQLALIPQACPMFEIAVTYTNFSNLPKNDIEITLTLAALTGSLPDSAALLQPHGHYSPAPETNRQITVAWPAITVLLSEVKPFRSEFAVISVPLGREGNWAHGMIDPTDVNSTGMTIRVTAAITVDGRVKRAGADWTISEDVTLACSYGTDPIYPIY